MLTKAARFLIYICKFTTLLPPQKDVCWLFTTLSPTRAAVPRTLAVPRTMPGPAAPVPRGARSQPSVPSKQRARKSPARARGASPARAPSAPKARRTSPTRVQARAPTPERAPSAPRKRTRASPASKRPPSAAAPAAAAPAAKPAAKRRQAPKPDPGQACRWPVMLCGLVTLCVCALLSPLALVLLQRTPFDFMARAPAPVPLSPRPPGYTPMWKTWPIWPASAAQAADWPRLAETRGSLRHDLALKGASGEPAGRGLSRLVFHIGMKTADPLPMPGEAKAKEAEPKKE